MEKISPDELLEKFGGQFARFLPQFRKLGLSTARDLLFHLPIRIEDYSQVIGLKDMEKWKDQTATIEAKVFKVKIIRTRNPRFRTIVEADLEDSTGRAQAVWFNLYMVAKSLKEGEIYRFSGKITEMRGRPVLSHPSYTRAASQGSLIPNETGEVSQTGRIIPIYKEVKGITSKGIGYLIGNLMERTEKIPEYLPSEILTEYNLPDINKALYAIHRPTTANEWNLAKNRFDFEDLLRLQIRNQIRRAEQLKEKSFPVPVGVERIKNILPELPYPLTHDQKKTLWEIMQDMGRDYPMNRLLQGDVGSGKTVVAVLAALLVHEEKLTTAFLAPTEILARQHYQTIKKILGQIRMTRRPAIALLTGTGAEITAGKHTETEISKTRLLKMISGGEVAILTGTHALIQKNIAFKNLGLAVVDEQHRFGVRQRADLISHGSHRAPHLLSMSATPIPRTLALTLYGDLDISVIKELPKGRKKIITRIVPKNKREEAYRFVREQIENGRQAFVICPRIESHKRTDWKIIPDANPDEQEVKTVNEEYRKLSLDIFPDLRIGKLHGQMKAKDKERAMRDFQNRRTDILVSTSVVEVGVDVPNASVMWIEGADRFGLAQLYQFRGRVGRGEYQSYCLLFPETDSRTGQERLKAIVNAKNGLELAEMDLKLRGPGELLGEQQSGFSDSLMIAIQKPELLQTATEAASKIISAGSEMSGYPLLLKKSHSGSDSAHPE